MSTPASVIELAGAAALALYGARVFSDGLRKSAETRLRSLARSAGSSARGSFAEGFAAAGVLQSAGAVSAHLAGFADEGLLEPRRAADAALGASAGTLCYVWLCAGLAALSGFWAAALPLTAFGYFASRPGGGLRESAVRFGRGGFGRLRRAGETALGLGLFLLGLALAARACSELAPALLAFQASFPVRAAVLAFLLGAAVSALARSTGAASALLWGAAAGGACGFAAGAAYAMGAGAVFMAAGRRGFRKERPGSAAVALAQGFYSVFLLAFGVLGLAASERFLGPGIDALRGGELCLALGLFETARALPALACARLAAAAALRRLSGGAAPGSEGAPLAYLDGRLRSSPELNLPRAERLACRLADTLFAMYERFRLAAFAKGAPTPEENEARSRSDEEDADRLKENLLRFLLDCARHSPGPATGDRVIQLSRLVDSLEDATDECDALMGALRRAAAKDGRLEKAQRRRLAPAALVLRHLLDCARASVSAAGPGAEARRAGTLKKAYDELRDDAFKEARRRLEAGGEVKGELAFAELLRRMDKVAALAWEVAREGAAPERG